jgi:tRNA pseudouridine38-40 synthase
VTEPAAGESFGILLTVAYDGRRFSGFARQKAARTIAGELDGAVRAIDPRASPVRGSSRTDAGVHALGQRAAFDTMLAIPPRGWAGALAAELPSEIAIVRAARVPPGYEPRHHALRKSYRYVVVESPVRDPFLEGLAWRLPNRLNHAVMREEAALLVGRHDFAAFRSAQDPRTDTVRNIFRAELKRSACDARRLLIEVEGDRFLYRMVRIIAGTLVDVGRGRREPGAVARAIEARDRRLLGETAPAAGLYLVTTELDDEGHDAWPEEVPRIDDMGFVA